MKKFLSLSQDILEKIFSLKLSINQKIEIRKKKIQNKYNKFPFYTKQNERNENSFFKEKFSKTITSSTITETQNTSNIAQKNFPKKHIIPSNIPNITVYNSNNNLNIFNKNEQNVPIVLQIMNS